ncbi:MAG: cytochrome c biogenesis protein ResB [Actinomycetales bacterium]|nr:cytochrome c biogenesis protein ResB [Actinomycetales bacterium]
MTEVRDTAPETVDARQSFSTAPVETDPAAPVGIGVSGWLRWVWRTLTSMRTALILLFLLALASVPGSLLPQRGTNPIRVNDYLANDPVKGRILDRLGFFDVFSAPWFAAIYLLLFVSLAGCVLPRSLQHWRILRSRPPAAPRNLGRLPEHRRVEPAPGTSPQQSLDAAAAWLRKARWRVDTTSYDGSTGTVAAEKGYARETGNLVFHLALLGLLVAIAYGSLFGFKGTVIVREGSSFADTRGQFDSFTPGKAYDDATLPPFAFTLTKFTADYQRGGQQNGAAREFSADVRVVSEPGAAPTTQNIQVNDPLVVGGVKVFLVGHGYAPTITVRDAKGEVVFRDSVVFLPQDGNFTSTGVVKAPDTVPQLGLQGFFLPTAAVDSTLGPHSTFPAADDPAVFLSAWTGDLGLDSGRPQSVYKLDTTRMTRLGIDALRPGESWTLPGGHGTVTLDGYIQWASFTVASDPGKELALLAAVAAITGLALSLLVRRRRVWVRVSAEPGGVTVVDVAGLTRSEHASVAEDVDALAAAIGTTTSTRTTAPEGAEENR